jgi:hypothetical protein
MASLLPGVEGEGEEEEEEEKGVVGNFTAVLLVHLANI